MCTKCISSIGYVIPSDAILNIVWVRERDLNRVNVFESTEFHIYLRQLFSHCQPYARNHRKEENSSVSSNHWPHA